LENPYDPSQGYADDDGDKPYDPWEDGDAAAGDGSDPGFDPNHLDIEALRRRSAERQQQV
jgi:hypothetical protein